VSSCTPLSTTRASCSQRWGGVLASSSTRGGGVSLVLPFPFPVIPTHPHAVTTPRAVARGGGAGCWSSPRPPLPSVSLSPSRARTTHVAPLSTPRAIARGSGWGCFMGPVSSSPFPLACPPSRLPSPSSFHPPTTPRAVAHEAGVGGVSAFVALLPTTLHCCCCCSFVVVVVPPAIHPTSSGS
jgi:hypothetical protein